MPDFSQISKKYERDSIVQKSASHDLLELLALQKTDNVLDLGCGTGHLSGLIKLKTDGKVVGIDPAEGMVRQATEKYGNEGISFFHLPAEKIAFKEQFEVIFCNSVFQWFKEPARVLKRCHDALMYNGRMAIQAPAKENYCPNFIEAVQAVKSDALTRDTFAGFTSPWFFLNTAEEYRELFETTGFKVKKSEIVRVSTYHTPEDVFKIFESGAAAGYLNQQFNADRLTTEYIQHFKKIVQDAFQGQADRSGTVELVFYRIYLLAVKDGDR